MSLFYSSSGNEPTTKFTHRINNCVVSICLGDITLERVDCVVNAANGGLLHGGGVAGAVKRRGGEKLERECDDLMRKRGREKIPEGEAVHTQAGDMLAIFCIHAVGPIWRGGKKGERNLREKLLLVRKISIPAISSGIFGFPKEFACIDISNSVIEYLEENKDTKYEEIRLTNIDSETTNHFLQFWKNYSKKQKKRKKENMKKQKKDSVF